MSDVRADHADREAEAWAGFERALGAVPRERWEETGVLEGWTAKEMLWHVAGWLDKCATKLEAMNGGTAGDAGLTTLTVDERNAVFADAARGMDADAVWTGLIAARGRVRRAWGQLAEIDDAATEEFAEETYEHYDEHRADLELLSPA
jgi:hypothetical protein